MLNQAKVAFALGGLAGNNAHGAGFLQVALDQDVRPSMISCTSGQIYWTYLYLKALQESHKLLLKEEIKKETTTLERIQKSAEFLLGVHEFVRPVYPHEVMQDMAKIMLGASLKFVAAATAWAKTNGIRSI